MDRLWVPLLAVTVLLAGCAGEEETDTSSGSDNNGDGNQTIEPPSMTLDVGLSGLYPATIAYDPPMLEVVAGANVTLTFTNNDQNPVPSHDWALEGFEDTAKTQVIGNGESDTITFIAPEDPGDYTFYCSVPGHRGNGMEGTLTVTAAAGGNETST